MRILVVNGDCIQTNSSANLCHIAYINGLVASGHDVTLLSADSRDYVLDKSIVIPECVKQHTYYGVTLYEKLALNKKKNQQVSGGNSFIKTQNNSKLSFKQKLNMKIKEMIVGLYGIHGIYSKFVKAAQKFRSNESFDYVISLSTPVTSHLLAHNLLKAKHVKAKHWIQIWEDPWYSDAYGINDKHKVYREEKRLLSFAEKVCYVSPLTLEKQKKLFPDSAKKMYWQPLPYYYKAEAEEQPSFAFNQYGYFGDYVPASRNLEPFYKAAVNCGISVNICGSPSDLFESTDKINIYPRLTLDKLRPIENNTNVLIFLCNKQGGQIPGKIYQYSVTNKTVLFILDGTEEEKEVLVNYFKKFNRYVFCENTVEDITRAIKAIESDNIGEVNNEPVDAFNPKETVSKILAGKSG
ncbi:MAG: hypothetical protein IJW04_03430 [Ruminococcus sp.]|nr:hypothetical protein [Ruminococcus sp.]